MTRVAVWDNELGMFLGAIDILPRLLPPPNKIDVRRLIPRPNAAVFVSNPKEIPVPRNVRVTLVNTGGIWVCDCEGLSSAITAGMWFYRHTYEKRGRQECLDDFAHALMVALGAVGAPFGDLSGA